MWRGYCSSCEKVLQVPPGLPCVQCASCHSVVPVSNPNSITTDPPPSPPPPLNGGTGSSQPPPPPHGSKRAVICGITYKNTSVTLEGCINDAQNMKYLLLTRFNFPQSQILMLSEEETDQNRVPTRRNIISALQWLVKGCKPGDSLVFHYSGHGFSQEDKNGDEVDGFDETLVPLDYETEGMIVDDEINELIVKPIPNGVKLHAIIDSCHSGTVLDLPFLCRMDRTGRYTWEDHRPPSKIWKGSKGGEVICISGCDDDQSSMDTEVLSKNACTGAMTYAFIQAIENGNAKTYANLLYSMRSIIQSAGNDVKLRRRDKLKNLIFTGETKFRIRQEPQLTANEPCDLYSKLFSL